MYKRYRTDREPAQLIVFQVAQYAKIFTNQLRGRTPLKREFASSHLIYSLWYELSGIFVILCAMFYAYFIKSVQNNATCRLSI